jgi:hypothetical protein
MVFYRDDPADPDKPVLSFSFMTFPEKTWAGYRRSVMFEMVNPPFCLCQ